MAKSIKHAKLDTILDRLAQNHATFEAESRLVAAEFDRDNVNLEIVLIAPVAMEKGVRFAIREGGRTIGAGTVTEVIA